MSVKRNHCLKESAFLSLAAAVLSVLMTVQACCSSPTGDEPAHLVSGLIAIRTGDIGYYRVNPPLLRVWSAIPVEIVFHPRIPKTVHSSYFDNTNRPEFSLGKEFLAINKGAIRRLFFVARLSRVPLIVCGMFFLWRLASFFGQRAARLAVILWCTSPLILGHGWVLSCDAVAGSAMVFVALAYAVWLRDRTWRSLLLVGMAWGTAISVKFTFCPLFAFAPAAIAIYQLGRGNLASLDTLRLLTGHLLQGGLALVVVWLAFGGAEVGLPLDEHHFSSQRFQSIVAALDGFGHMPSPFPRELLSGIDVQLVDMESERSAFLFGREYRGPLWFPLAAYAIKEQVAVLLGLALMPFCIIARPNTRWRSDGEYPLLFLLAAIVTMLMLMLCLGSNVIWNTRYFIPALPLIYVAVGATLPVYRVIVAGRPIDLIGIAMVLLVAYECSSTYPYYFSYLNPIAGGSYGTPPALHDSNFDYCQDVWRVEQWLRTAQGKRRASGRPARVLLVFHGPLCGSLDFGYESPTLGEVNNIIQRRAAYVSPEDCDYLVIARGLGQPAPWTVLNASIKSLQTLERIRELLRSPPDEFITPTYGVYRVVLSGENEFR